jgi:uncharacterized membrane protein
MPFAVFHFAVAVAVVFAVIARAPPNGTVARGNPETNKAFCRCRNDVILRTHAESLYAVFHFAVAVAVVVPSPLAGEGGFAKRNTVRGSLFLINAFAVFHFAVALRRHCEWAPCSPVAIQKLTKLFAVVVNAVILRARAESLNAVLPICRCRFVAVSIHLYIV